MRIWKYLRALQMSMRRYCSNLVVLKRQHGVMSYGSLRECDNVFLLIVMDRLICRIVHDNYYTIQSFTLITIDDCMSGLMIATGAAALRNLSSCFDGIVLMI